MTLHRREVMPTHYQLQLKLIVVLILQLTVESIIQYMYKCMYIGINLIWFININRQYHSSS